MKKSKKPPIWGLMGNQHIGKYSVAPRMWKSLFEFKKMNVEYFVLGGAFSSKISTKLKEYIKDANFVGANVALPWKKLVYEFCDTIEDSANQVETINTLVKQNDSIQGFNTDGIGICRVIKDITALENKKILLLGCGSSAQTVPFHLIKEKVKEIYFYDLVENRVKKLSRKYSYQAKKKGIKLTTLSRKEIEKIIPTTDIIINMTPCGMKGYPQKNLLTFREIKKTKQNCVGVEAVYTPYETPFLKKMKSIKRKISPGVNMLVEQAAESFYFAFDKKLNSKEKEFMKKIAKEELKK
jgi:shikimate dehydrogenase